MLTRVHRYRYLYVLLAAWLAVGASAANAKADNCSKRAARKQTQWFLYAYNEGRLPTLDKMFAREDSFEGYRVHTERDAPLSDDRSTLIPYFKERHGYEDVLTLKTLVLTKGDTPSEWELGFILNRKTSDPLFFRNDEYSGKGVLVGCNVFTLWSMGATPP